jgi:predicted Rossmann-fold nucleotide-binding protein
MTSGKLSDYMTALDLLCAQGEQFPALTRRASGRDTMFRHPTGEREPVAIDRFALSGTGVVYADGDMRQRFTTYGKPPVVTSRAVATIRSVFPTGRLVWGFSGFATAGYSYEAEAKGMSALLTALEASQQQPALIVDGGVSSGVVGLSGVLARRHRIPSIGFIPKQGLARFGPRDHLVVKTDTYAERERLVGTAPDVLVCVGGGDGARRECQAALENGSVVVVLALKSYGVASLDAIYVNAMLPVLGERRLFLCESVDDVPRVADLAAAAGLQFCTPKSRDRRMSTLTGLLLAA